MKIKEYKNIKRTKKLKSTLRLILSIHNDMKGCYFWRPPSKASCRRRYEDERSNRVHFILNGVEYKIDQSTDCSCKNIYYSLRVMVDGKKKDVRAIRRLI